MQKNVVCFHLITEENAYLSNWYPSRFEIDGVQYCCAEQYIMREKALLFGDAGRAQEILETDDPERMQSIGHDVEDYDENVWSGVRQLVAFRALRAKFAQNPEMRAELLATGDAVLAECARKDRVWGIGLGMDDPRRFEVSKWPGRGMLGFTLMMVREVLRDEE